MSNDTPHTSDDLPEHLAGMSNDELSPIIRGTHYTEVGSRTEVVGDVPFPETIPLTALAPDVQEEIRAQVSKVAPHAREETERRLVYERAQQLSRAYRTRSGPGEGATPYQLEQWALDREIADLNAEMGRIAEELASGSFDGKTGEKVLRFPEGSAGFTRHTERMREVIQQLAALEGYVGQKRLNAAERTTADMMRQRATALYINREASRRAEAAHIDEQVDALAQVRAAHLRTSL